jgi:molecular chaperone GrpE
LEIKVMTEHGKKHAEAQVGAKEEAKVAGQETAEKEATEKVTKDMVTITKEEYENLLKSKEAQDKLLYVYAEFENFKKRTARDLLQQMTYANEKLIKEVLPIIDNLCRAKDHACENGEKTEEKFAKFLEGIEMILKQLKDVLGKFGVEELSSVGEKFDPNFHEAMEQVESDEHDNGEVVNEYQKGYKFQGRVIRPSKVSVATKKKKEEE